MTRHPNNHPPSDAYVIRPYFRYNAANSDNIDGIRSLVLKGIVKFVGNISGHKERDKIYLFIEAKHMNVGLCISICITKSIIIP